MCVTNRTEIERLLQETGRTLKWLPEDYGDKKLELWNSFRDKTFGHVKSFDMANRILHQSDVIELLVGALRDALDKPMQKPMKLEALTKSVYQIPCWIEGAGVKETEPEVLDHDSNGLFGVVSTSTSGFVIRCDMDRYNKTWRCWASRPTDEEREAAAWEV